MSSIMANQVLSFESFASLENHLRAIKNKYTDMIKKYEETLGYILRDTKPTSLKTQQVQQDRKSTRLNSSHRTISYAVFCLKKKKKKKKIKISKEKRKHKYDKLKKRK